LPYPRQAQEQAAVAAENAAAATAAADEVAAVARAFELEHFGGDALGAHTARRVATVVAAVGTLLHHAVARRCKYAVELLLTRGKVSPNVCVPDDVPLPADRLKTLRATSALSVALEAVEVRALPTCVQSQSPSQVCASDR
jgi:hypothetical protein